MSVSLEKTVARDGFPALVPRQGDSWRNREDTFLTGSPGSGSPACSSSAWKLVPCDRHLPTLRPPPTLQPLAATFLLSVSVSSDFSDPASK